MRYTHTFTFDSYVLRGRNEREYPVEVTYAIHPGCPARLYGDYPHPAEPDEIEIVKALVDGDIDLTEADYEKFHNEACDRADGDLAEYRAEWEEYRAELRAENMAAESYILGRAA